MTKQKKTKILVAVLAGIFLLSVFLWWAFHVQLGRKLWYLLPDPQEYYIVIPTDMTPDAVENTTVTITKQTGFGKEEIQAAFWPEQSCFHAIAEDRGIYEICIKTSGRTVNRCYMEIAEEQTYCITYYTDGIIPLSVLGIPEDRLEWNGHQYWTITSNLGWEGVQAQLEAMDAHLATLTSSGENEAVYAYVSGKGQTTAYFGLHDPDGSNDWQWVTGEPLYCTNWHEGEPNTTEEQYGQFLWDFNGPTWNDARAPGQGSEAVYICEKDSID